MNEHLEKRITRQSPVHIVLVADDSGSMHGAPAAAATEAIHQWLNELHVAARGRMPYFRFSLVIFGSTATIVADDQNSFRAENLNVVDVDITGFQLHGASGSTNLAAALRLAADVVSRDGATTAHCPPFVFVFTDGRPTDERGHPTPAAAQAALDAAAQLKLLALPCGSPFVITLGFGDAWDDFMAKLATKPTLYHRLPNAQALIKLLPSIGTPTVEGKGTIADFVSQIERGANGEKDV